MHPKDNFESQPMHFADRINLRTRRRFYHGEYHSDPATRHGIQSYRNIQNAFAGLTQLLLIMHSLTYRRLDSAISISRDKGHTFRRNFDILLDEKIPYFKLAYLSFGKYFIGRKTAALFSRFK